MNLFRIEDNIHVIDNYNQFVKPKLQQQRANQLLKRQIRGLQGTVRNLHRQTQSLQGVTIPQYYMNHHQYYPGFGK
jgi:hypothetical protein